MSELQIISKYIKDNNNSINTLLGDIVALKQIGQGGNGLVYEGTLHGKIVAIKFLVSDDNQKLIRFKAEYFNINTLQPNEYIVKYINFEELKIDKHVFPMIIMNKYDCSLKKYRQNIGNPSWDNFILLFNFLIKSIEYIHAHGIIHRDLKPENILALEESTSFVLADFGIANYSEEYLLKAITKAGERIGNYESSAPEQASRNVSPCKTMDIYALGQLCQWFAFGNTHKGTGRIFLTSIFNNELAFLYDKIIDKCIQNNPHDRFQSIKEIESYIDDFQSSNIKDKIDPFDEMFIFNQTLRASFPESYGNIMYTSNMSRIKILIENIKSQKLKSDLYFNTGRFNSHISKLDLLTDLILSDSSNLEIRDNIILINESEFSLKGIWVYCGDSVYDDILIFHVNTLEEIEINNEKVRSYAIANNVQIIDSNLAYSGYFINNDIPEKIINSEHRVRPIVSNQSKNKYYFVAPLWNNFIYHKNDSEIIKIQSSELNLEIINNLRKTISFNKHPDVVICL